MKPFLLILCTMTMAMAQVPHVIHYQGRITVSGTNFHGDGQFKFALVDNAGTVLWSNSPIAANQPGTAVTLPVAQGVYGVQLGDTGLTNMAAIPATVFSGADVRLRVWFSNGTLGFQQLTPDQRIGAVGYAIMAGSVPDNAITSSKIATGSVTPDKLAATDVLELTNLGELFVNAVKTGDSPKQFTGTVTINDGQSDVVATNVVFVESPASELVNTDGSLVDYGVSNITLSAVSPLVMRRPLTNNISWASWFRNCGAGLPSIRDVTVSFTNGPTMLMTHSFPTAYVIERGSDGIYYETITVRSRTYLPQ